MKVRKLLSKYYTKLLVQENTKQYYIDNGWQYDRDMDTIEARIYYFGVFIKDLKKILNGGI